MRELIFRVILLFSLVLADDNNDAIPIDEIPPSIFIDITASFVASKSSIKFSGKDSSIVLDKERQTFNITDSVIKDIIQKTYTKGIRPEQVYVDRNIPAEDFYEKWNLNEVTRIISPTSAKLIRVSCKPVEVSKKVFSNPATATEKLATKLSQTVLNSAKNYWSKGNPKLEMIGSKINYKINISDAKVDFTYNNGYNTNLTKDHETELGFKEKDELLLEPGEDVVSTIRALKCSMNVELTYTASLRGACIVRFPKPLLNSHYWWYEIHDLLFLNGKPEVTVKELLTVDYYTNPKLETRKGGAGLSFYYG